MSANYDDTGSDLSVGFRNRAVAWIESPDAVDRHVGRRIWQRRRETGLSRRELGERIGIGLKQVNKYETGANRVSAGRLYDIAQVLEVDASWFFDGFADGGRVGSGGPAAHDDPPGDTQEIRKLLAVYHVLPREVRSRLLRLVRAIAETDAA